MEEVVDVFLGKMDVVIDRELMGDGVEVVGEEWVVME